MKVDRLFSILLLLLETDRVSARSLAERFCVSVRTIYRDIEDLCASGVPVVTYPGSGGGIALMEGYKVDKRLFTPRDISTLMMGLDALSTTLPRETVQRTLALLQSCIPQGQHAEVRRRAGQIRIDPQPWGGYGPLADVLDTVQRAIDAHRMLSFWYVNAVGEAGPRVVEPYRLHLKTALWYLQGYDAEKGYRTYRLTRMSDVCMLEAAFEPREDVDMGALEFEPHHRDMPHITLMLRIHPSILHDVAAVCGYHNIVKLDEHNALAAVTVVDDAWADSFVLGWGERCECLAPERVRVRIGEKVRAMAGYYGGATIADREGDVGGHEG